MPGALPVALTAPFADEKAGQWKAFLRRTEIALAPEPFVTVQAQIAALVMPPALALSKGIALHGKWPGGPWHGLGT
ncbi:MAG: hypothetical protein JWR80_905 [Bradyrhizobium sp.]|nr:hypothetical protein [Bradyrhizobium sp.]